MPPLTQSPPYKIKFLPRSFYARPAITLAPALIGKILCRRDRNTVHRARIVETEAYIGEHDLACHAAKGRTKRTEIMFGAAGHVYMYFIYGLHWMLNVVAATEGDAQAVLIRAAEPLDDWNANLSGPARLARALNLNSDQNGLDLTNSTALFIAESDATEGKRLRVKRSKRIGVEYSGRWQHRLLRFHDADSLAVSGHKAAPRSRPDKR